MHFLETDVRNRCKASLGLKSNLGIEIGLHHRYSVGESVIAGLDCIALRVCLESMLVFNWMTDCCSFPLLTTPRCSRSVVWSSLAPFAVVLRSVKRNTLGLHPSIPRTRCKDCTTPAPTTPKICSSSSKITKFIPNTSFISPPPKTVSRKNNS